MSLKEFGYAPMPWANGGGTTWEVARHPPDPATQFIWRVSIAEIDGTGPFSALPGIDRIFTLASSAPIALQVGGAERQAAFATPICFSGEESVSCTTAQAATALNVMTRRGRATANVEIVGSRQAGQIEATDWGAALLVPLAGSAELHDRDGSRALRALEATRIGDRPGRLTGRYVAAIVSVTTIQEN